MHHCCVKCQQMYDARVPRRAFFFLQKQSVATMFFFCSKVLSLCSASSEKCSMTTTTFGIIPQSFFCSCDGYHSAGNLLITLLKNFALHSTKNLEILIYEEQKCIKSNTFFCVWVRLRSTRAKKLRVSDSNKFKFQNSKLNNFVCVCVCFPLENAAFLSSHLFQKNKSSIIGNGFSIK